MLEQVVQGATQTPPIGLLDAGVAILVLKATIEFGTKGIKAWQERSRTRGLQASASLEQAKTLGISMVRDASGEHKPALVAFCPSHIEIVKQVTSVERDMANMKEDIGEIKGDVKVIRQLVGNGR